MSWGKIKGLVTLLTDIISGREGEEGDFDSPDHPLIAERPTRSAAAATKDKRAQSTLPVVKEPITEIREAPKPIPSFNFEHEIQKIRIPVPLSELVKNEDFKRSLSKLLQSSPPSPPLTQ
jgi:hypothetical protein